MKLLTKEVLKRLPRLGETSEQEDPIVQVKFFTPDAQWSWFGTEFDQKDIFFGYVKGLENELGYFSLSELKQVRGSLGLPVERDMYFKPCPLSEVMKD
ncbi:hypothetical protein ES703_08215 [subsurface metagenome]